MGKISHSFLFFWSYPHDEAPGRAAKRSLPFLKLLFKRGFVAGERSDFLPPPSFRSSVLCLSSNFFQRDFVAGEQSDFLPLPNLRSAEERSDLPSFPQASFSGISWQESGAISCPHQTFVQQRSEATSAPCSPPKEPKIISAKTGNRAMKLFLCLLSFFAKKKVG